jgi:FMN phosphatase YigB (HAD superfamily)
MNILMITHIVFDLNGTLVHRTRLRPGLFRLLSTLRRMNITIVIWTSAMRHNAVKRIHPFRSFVDLLITRNEVCVRDCGPPHATLKPESHLEEHGIRPENTIFVDDSPRKVRFNTRSRTLYIPTYKGGRYDRQLFHLIRRLESDIVVVVDDQSTQSSAT